MARTYLDWAASAPPETDIVDSAAEVAKEYFGNPSSRHAEGRDAEQLLEESRGRVAKALSVRPEQLIFTSGGTEANNIVITSLLSQPSLGEIVVSGIEHSSVYEPAALMESRGLRVRWIPAELDGRVDPARITAALTKETALVLVMHVNNETGAIQPIREIAGAIRAHEQQTGKRVHLHCDAVQALGKIPVAYSDLDVDSASFSAHKIGGLRGIGALYLKAPLPVLFRGGGQERNIRPGTENLPGIWSFAEAAARAAASLPLRAEYAEKLRKQLIDGVSRIEGGRLVPELALLRPENYSPFILSAAFPPLPGEVLVRVLNDAGFAISTGSACGSKGHKERRILMNMGIDEETARSAVRISIGATTTEESVSRFLEVLEKEVHTWNVPARA